MNTTQFLQILAGEWAGAGLGQYPTIEDFEYQETLRLTLDDSRPLLHYEQKTQRRNSDLAEYVPSHWETGFLQLLPDNQVEVANAQSGGRVEVLAGTIEAAPAGLVIHLRSIHFANDSRMAEATRTITVNGDSLHYTMYMQTNQVPHLAVHLEATLQRRQETEM
jgi:hypothetical protein